MGNYSLVQKRIAILEKKSHPEFQKKCPNGKHRCKQCLLQSIFKKIKTRDVEYYCFILNENG